MTRSAGVRGLFWDVQLVNVHVVCLVMVRSSELPSVNTERYLFFNEDRLFTVICQELNMNINHSDSDSGSCEEGHCVLDGIQDEYILSRSNYSQRYFVYVTSQWLLSYQMF